MTYALAGWLRRLEHCPIQQRVAGAIPSQDSYLTRLWARSLVRACVAGSQLMFVCLSVSLSAHPFPLSLESVNIPPGEDLRKKKKPLASVAHLAGTSSSNRRVAG